MLSVWEIFLGKRTSFDTCEKNSPETEKTWMRRMWDNIWWKRTHQISLFNPESSDTCLCYSLTTLRGLLSFELALLFFLKCILCVVTRSSWVKLYSLGRSSQWNNKCGKLVYIKTCVYEILDIFINVFLMNYLTNFSNFISGCSDAEEPYKGETCPSIFCDCDWYSASVHPNFLN